MVKTPLASTTRSNSIPLHNAILVRAPAVARPLVQFRKAGCCRAIGLQWRSTNSIQHLDLHEKELVVGGAYDCFLILVDSGPITGRPRLSSGAHWSGGVMGRVVIIMMMLIVILIIIITTISRVFGDCRDSMEGLCKGR